MHAAAASLALLLALGLAAGCGGDETEASRGVVHGHTVDPRRGPRRRGRKDAPERDLQRQRRCGFDRLQPLGARTRSTATRSSSARLRRRRSPVPRRPTGSSARISRARRVAAWSVDGSELVLADADDDELLRYAEASLLGDWEVTAFLDGDAVSSRLPGTRSPRPSPTTARSRARRAATPIGRRSRPTGRAFRSGRPRRRDVLPRAGGRHGAGGCLSRGASGRCSASARRRVALAARLTARTSPPHARGPALVGGRLGFVSTGGSRRATSRAARAEAHERYRRRRRRRL